MGDGKTKFDAMGQKLKGDTMAAVESEQKAMAEVKNQLAAIKDNPQLAQMYQDNAQVGAGNLAGELPLLKVHATGRSTKSMLADGSEPTDGYFFYKPTGQQFETIKCHILTISRGFRAKSMEEGKDDQFNQILGGVIIDGVDLKPFIMYFTGLKLSNLWEFGKMAKKYTHAKPVPIPMFALTVELTTKKVDNSFGKSWIIGFEIVKSDLEDESPILVMDPGEFTYLKDNVEVLEETIASIIAAKSSKDIDEPTKPIKATDVEPEDPGPLPD